MSTTVNAFLRVVANGIALAPNGIPSRAKATLVVTPEPVPTGSAGQSQGIDLAQWPTQLAARIREGKSPASGRFEITIYLQHVGEAGEPVLGKVYAVQATAIRHRQVDPRDWVGATAAWQGALGRELKEPWAKLANDIVRSLEGRKHKAQPASQYNAPSQAPSEGFDADGAILAREARADDMTVVKGVVPVRQGRFAIDEERVRAARVLAKTTLGPHLYDDEPPIDVRRDRKGTTPDFDAARRAELYRQFRDSTERTDGDRKRTHASFDAVRGVVTGGDVAAPQPVGSHEDRALVPTADDVQSGRERAKQRATHAYGTWLQRRPELTFKTSQDNPGRPVDATRIVDKDAAQDRVRGLFYAFQGDPFLSRLFCLAIDLEFDLPKPLQRSDGPVYLRITAEQADGSPRRTPIVATAAKLEGRGFWPASIFEAGVTTKQGSQTLIRESALVEQSGGFWHFDRGYAPKNPAEHAPRYDLTSLDIRRAVDSKPDGVDRGERHLTAGFTILDNERGEQVARDLALAAVNAPQVAEAATSGVNRPLVVLHAEELTIGRRVDVASASPGTPVESIVWRSLMHRYVRYVGMDRASDRLLAALLKDREAEGGYLDEGAFQVAARLMPMVHGGQGAERQVEAVPEEAIYLWDGTPAGVLTEPGSGADNAGQELPFRRKVDPPSMGGSGRALCPSPLRFGVPYLFRWRSLFLGGGSPPPQATMVGADAGRSMLPPALEGKAVPRRFLRHEGIAPPVLLLPRHLATVDYGPMGFEQADQAIVRSAVAADPLARETDTPSPGPAYIPLSRRSQPAETMRVFVPPEVAPELVERHGLLDNTATVKAVRRGGLLDVSFDPADHTETPERKATGFPTVLTRSEQGFGLDPTPYARAMSRGDGDRIGIPVFEPGGRNATPEGGTGYLPDPAAEEYCIRLRVQRSGRYLAGSVKVQIYDAAAGVAFPNALPLVVTVRREDRDRSEPATKIGEVVEGGTALRWMSPAGRISSSRPKDGRGTRVRHVVVELRQGEDFALEVVCLPKPALLARTFSLPETVAMQLAEARMDKAVRERLQKLTGPLAEEQVVGGSESGLTGLTGRPVPGGGAVSKAAQSILDTMQVASPVEEIAALTTLRVCHAVNAPPATSETILSELRARRPTIPSTVGWENKPDLPDAPGAERVLITGQLRLDLERVDALELVATSAAAGARALDDTSRARSLSARRAGRWPKLTTRNGERRYVAPRFVVGFDVDEAGRVTYPMETVTLLRVDNLPARAEAGADGLFGARSGRLTEVSLGRLFAAAIAERPISLPVDGVVTLPEGMTGKDLSHVVKAAQVHRIADTRARKLLLKVTTLSRSAEAFETAPRYGGGGQAMLQRRQPLRASDQTRTSREFELWVGSTKRPPACAVRRPEVAPVISREAVNGKGGVIQRVCRKVLTRLYLKRGWNASGEGERLGIVLWPPSYFDQKEKDVDRSVVVLNGRTVSIASLQDIDLGPGGAFITRWGGDPIRQDASPQEGVLIPPAAFEDAVEGCASPHKPRIIHRARMPIRGGLQPPNGGSEAEPAEYMEVTLLTFEPCFDLDREEWYVDVDLKPNRASDPFVKLGLVRYQEHAINADLQVSYPTVVHAQLMPRRDLVLERGKGENGKPVLCVTLRGHGSTGIQPMDLERLFRGDERLPNILAGFAKLARPEVRVTVFHETSKDDIILRTPLSLSNTWSIAKSHIDVSVLEWRVDVPLPEARMQELGAGTFVVYIEEVDRRMPASYAGEPVTMADQFKEQTYREQGPRFSARVPFLELE